MNTRLYIIVAFIIMIFASACTEKIDIDLDDTYTRLVVEGNITSDTMAHLVHLSLTTSFYYSQPAPGVTGATVTISDGSTLFPLTEVPGKAGYYQTDPEFSATPGKTYTLNIELAEEINGYKSYSASAEMKTVATVDSIDIKYLDTWNVYEIGCYALDTPTKDFYMFNIYKNGKLITDTINEILITDDRFYNGNYTNGIGVGYLDEDDPSENVHPGDTIMLQIAGITEEFYKFIYAVQIETGYKNPLFSGSPANIKGNISNGAIGYFAAYSVKYATTIAP